MRARIAGCFFLQAGFFLMCGAAVAAPKTSGGPGGVGATDGSSPLVLWLKPETLPYADGQTIANWPDSSGTGNHAFQTDPDRQPVFRADAHNGLGAAHFTAANSNDLLTTVSVTHSGSGSFALVHKSDRLNSTSMAFLGSHTSQDIVLETGGGGANYRWVAGGSWSAGVASLSASGHSTNLALVSGRRSIPLNFQTLYVNGEQKGTTTHTTETSTYTVGLGQRRTAFDPPLRPYDGEISEAIAFTTNISVTERILIDNYLNAKFFTNALAANARYTGSTPAKGNYDRDVFGVGRVSADDFVANSGQAGFGIEVNAGLDDDEWILAGHRFPGGNSLVTDGVPAGMNYRWERVWYLDKTGNMDATLSFGHADGDLLEPPGGTGYELLYSATSDPYNWTAMGIAGAVNGDTVSFAVPDASLQDGYYTLASDAVPSVPAAVTGGTGPGGYGATNATSPLVLWLTADTLDADFADGAAVSLWRDASGHTNNATALYAINTEPTYRAGLYNGFGAAEFDRAVSNTLTSARSVPIPVGDSIFVVHRSYNPTGDQCLVGANGNLAYVFGPNGSAYRWFAGVGWTEGVGGVNGPAGWNTTDLGIVSGVRSLNADFMNIYRDGSLMKGVTHSDASAAAQYCIGARRPQYPVGDYFDGTVAEVIVISTNVNQAERILIENYLNAKYFTSNVLGLNSRYAGCTPAKGDYDRDVFGIGRVGAGHEVTASGSMGLGIAAIWGLADGEWILAGHRTAANGYVPYEGTGTAAKRWARVWYLDVCAGHGT